MTEADKARVRELCAQVTEHIRTHNICCFKGRSRPMFLISETYPGVWMEHLYDSVFYAQLFPGNAELPINTFRTFFELAKPDGQLPFAVFDPARMGGATAGYSQIQECVSFAALCLETYRLSGDEAFLKEAYAVCTAWIGWLETHRMTTGRGLIELFVGYDTGHDNSGRLEGLSCKGNYVPEGSNEPANAAVLPPDEEVAPVIAVDMNCNYYGDLMACGKMAEILAKTAAAAEFYRKASTVKQNLFTLCYDPEQAFFFDVDKYGRKRRYLSSTVFHPFLEHLLDPEADKAVIDRIYREHIKNPAEFWTPYPFPSMAASDPTFDTSARGNSWGYFSQGLIALRCTRWMDHYGFGADFDILCERWIDAWTRCADRFHFGQELDPFTGEPSVSSEWYSSCMLFYLYAAKRLKLTE